MAGTLATTAASVDAVGVIVCDGFFGAGLKTYQGIEDSIFFNQVCDRLGAAGSIVNGSSGGPAVTDSSEQPGDNS